MISFHAPIHHMKPFIYPVPHILSLHIAWYDQLPCCLSLKWFVSSPVCHKIAFHVPCNICDQIPCPQNVMRSSSIYLLPMIPFWTCTAPMILPHSMSSTSLTIPFYILCALWLSFTSPPHISTLHVPFTMFQQLKCHPNISFALIWFLPCPHSCISSSSNGPCPSWSPTIPFATHMIPLHMLHTCLILFDVFTWLFSLIYTKYKPLLSK